MSGAQSLLFILSMCIPNYTTFAFAPAQLTTLAWKLAKTALSENTVIDILDFPFNVCLSIICYRSWADLPYFSWGSGGVDSCFHLLKTPACCLSGFT